MHLVYLLSDSSVNLMIESLLFSQKGTADYVLANQLVNKNKLNNFGFNDLHMVTPESSGQYPMQGNVSPSHAVLFTQIIFTQSSI